MTNGMAWCAAGSKTASPLLILGKSRMRKRARTDPCGGRSAMVVPTATTIYIPRLRTEQSFVTLRPWLQELVWDHWPGANGLEPHHS